MCEAQDDKAEDTRIEYQALRTELQQADQACLLMTGFIIAAIGALYSIEDSAENVLWIASFLCLIGLLYYTEKRFIIREINSFIANEISTKKSGFKWEKHVRKLRREGNLRSLMILRPYNAEVLICILGSLSPLTYPDFLESFQNNLIPSITWLPITIAVVVLSVINTIKYSQLP